uniref:8.6 kDa transglutaminase substrate n=1 Tax=Tachypleus tridentatus TaxID=6853 RepID=TRGS_TACTR|nr:RecName: Full=8.6 kDa transglutaminase substrate [Tachypleus tridentatus]AAB24710.1 8.6 kda transglutaminase substrate [Tachypleus tridentatus=Japanese horseshoe crabs, hemocytes, Peptide, 81 aa] [Tachypleus tridentatus]
TSQPDCSVGCDTSYCPDTSSCNCGTFADYCKCCQYCNACAGKTCNMIAGQSCEDGYLCRPPEGYSYIDVVTGRISSLCLRI